jgi:ComF family protein
MELPECGYYHFADNDTALRFAGRFPFEHAASFAWFINDGLLQHLVHGLKYKGKKETGMFLGGRLGIRLRESGWGALPDVVVPVPLHPKKLASRGYNQSELIARGIGDALRIPVATDALIRTKDTESQTKKSREERVNNMADAFVIKEAGTLAGRHVLLCDDVLTTGATIEACALALLKEERIKISIVTIGIAIS